MQTIGIITSAGSAVGKWDPDSISSGICGSEEAVIYISHELAKLGFRVIVFGDPPNDSRHSVTDANPRFVNVVSISDFELDIAISWRLPDIGSYVKKFVPKVFLWPHDDCNHSIAKENIDAFDDVLWLSNWQRSRWVSLNPGFAKFENIFGNGISPEQFNCTVHERINPYSCMYGSNYARGLEILLYLWPHVKKYFPRATLDIYYGWQHWGLMSPDTESWMREKIEDLKSEDVVDYGLVGHRELNAAYEKASLWTYPCIISETFCISALRAQLSGAVPVIINRAALAETVRFGFICSKEEDYFANLLNALRHAERITLDDRKNMGGFVLQEFTWEKVAAKWVQLFLD